jgi:outer membrane immunogenic protein
VPALIDDNDDTNVGAVNFEAALEWAVAGGARVGYAFGNFLPFAYGGGVVGGGEGTANFAGGGFTDSETHTGYIVGTGFDYAFDEHWSAGARWAYVNMSEETYQFAAPAKVGFDAHLAIVTVNYRFQPF